MYITQMGDTQAKVSKNQHGVSKDVMVKNRLATRMQFKMQHLLVNFSAGARLGAERTPAWAILIALTASSRGPG